jgi:hypothetical protein
MIGADRRGHDRVGYREHARMQVLPAGAAQRAWPIYPASR